MAKVQSVLQGLGQSGQSGGAQNSDTQNDLFSPDNIAKIKSIAEGLGITGNEGAQSSLGDDLFSPANIAKIKSTIADDHKNKERINLLLALKPYLGEQRSSKIDLAVKILQFTKFSGLFKDYFKK